MSDFSSSFTKISKESAAQMAKNTINQIKEYRKNRLEKAIERELIKSKKSFLVKYFGFAPIDRDGALEKVKNDDTWFSEYFWISIAGQETEKDCEKVLELTRYSAEDFIYISGEDLETIRGWDE